MARLRTTRCRRVRQVSPAVLQAIHEGLLTGASAPQVMRSLRDRRDLPEDQIPSERTISNIARDMRSDDSGAWQLTDAEPGSVNLVLRVLGEVVPGPRDELHH